MMRLMTPGNGMLRVSPYSDAFQQRMQGLSGPGQLPAYLKTKQIKKLEGGVPNERVQNAVASINAKAQNEVANTSVAANANVTARNAAANRRKAEASCSTHESDCIACSKIKGDTPLTDEQHLERLRRARLYADQNQGRINTSCGESIKVQTRYDASNILIDC